MTALDFNKKLIRVHPSSQLSAIVIDQGAVIRLYYQTEDNGLKEHIYTRDSGWLHHETSIGAAITGTSIAAAALSQREITVIYQDNTCTVRTSTTKGCGDWAGGKITLLLHPRIESLSLGLLGV